MRRILKRFVGNGVISDNIALHHLVIKQDINEFQQLIESADVNSLIAQDKDGRTVLHLAAERRCEEFVRLLLQKGAGTAATDIYGRTILHSAAEGGNKVIVQLLLDRGVDPNVTDHLGRTAMLWAVECGHYEIARLLVKTANVENINKIDRLGRSTLWQAAWRGGTDMVALLLENGADINVKNKHGISALCAAVKNKHKMAAFVLLEKGALIDENEVIQFLLSIHFEVTIEYKVYHLAGIQWAANRGNAEVVRRLLEKGANARASDDSGRTVLHWAAKGGNIEVVRQLLEHRADAMASDKDGQTVLHLAARGGNAEVIRQLLEHGANARASNNSGWTVLHLAARGGNAEVVRQLLKYGADAMAGNKGGHTVLHSAARGGNAEVIQLLRD
jgi:ankyrin repeat protein